MSSVALLLVAAVGVNIHLPPNDTLDLADDLGVEWVRVDFNWDVVEPANDVWDFSTFDRIVDAAEARGLKVFANLGYGPAWASTGDRRGDGPGNDVPQVDELREYVTTVVSRYGTRVAAWGTWNEPNLGDFFEGNEDEWLASAFIPTVDAIRAACPSCLIAGPEVATIGNEYHTYLAMALEARGAVLDAVSMHDYAAFAEEDAGAGTTNDSFFNKLESHRVIEIGGVVVWEGHPSIREVLDASDHPGLPVWITECGKEAAMTEPDDLEAQRRRIELLVTAMGERPWWTNTIIYELAEEHPGGMWPDIHWGLALRVAGPDDSFADNWQTKPAYDWLKAWLAMGPGTPDAGVGPGTPDGGVGPTAPDGAVGPGAPDAAGPGGGLDDGGGASGCGCEVGGRRPGPLALLALVLVALSARGPCRRRGRASAAGRRAR